MGFTDSSIQNRPKVLYMTLKYHNTYTALQSYAFLARRDKMNA